MMFSYKVVQRGEMNLEVLWSGLWPNKRLVMTVSALCSFWRKCPLLMAFQFLRYCFRSWRGNGLTTEALALFLDSLLTEYRADERTLYNATTKMVITGYQRNY